jgi:hypothetical protein
MAVVATRLIESSVIDAPTAVIAVACAAVLLLTRLNSAWLIAGGVAVGLLFG